MVVVAEGSTMAARRWPVDGIGRVPYWLYTDADIYAAEQELIFRGPSWSYVAFEAEIPEPGDFVRTSIGDPPVIVPRDRHGAAHVVVNRCAHRGVQLCTEP